MFCCRRVDRRFCAVTLTGDLNDDPHRTQMAHRRRYGIRSRERPTGSDRFGLIARSTMRSRCSSFSSRSILRAGTAVGVHDNEAMNSLQPMGDGRLECRATILDLVEESRRWVVRRTEQHPAPRVRQEQALHRSRNADIGKPSFFFHLIWVERPMMRKHLLQPQRNTFGNSDLLLNAVS